MIMFRNSRPDVERVTRKLTLLNSDGLQASPATQFVSCVLSFKSTVTIHFNGKQYPADRILEVLLADLNGGDSFELEAEGPDARRAVDRIGRLPMFLPEQSVSAKPFLRWEALDGVESLLPNETPKKGQVRNIKRTKGFQDRGKQAHSLARLSGNIARRLEIILKKLVN